MKIKKDNLADLEQQLKESGYKFYRGHLKSEDFGYWKSFIDNKSDFFDNDAVYQIALLFYDYSKYPLHTDEHNIGIQFECILSNNNKIARMDLTVSDDNMTVSKFEKLCCDYYHDFVLPTLNTFNKNDK